MSGSIDINYGHSITPNVESLTLMLALVASLGNTCAQGIDRLVAAEATGARPIGVRYLV